MKPFPQKWRPSLSMIVVTMLLFVLSLPLAGIWLFRFYDSHLVKETESELIAQGAFVQAMVAHELKKRAFDGASLRFKAKKKADNTFSPILPELDLSSSPIFEPRADALPSEKAAAPVLADLASAISDTISSAQKITLAGFRVLDPNGIVVIGRSELGLSLMHVPEVRMALRGQYASAIRKRISNSPTPPIYSISRGTGIRVFVAMPIEYQGKVAGAVYLSRTPSHFLRELYGQRWKIGAAAAFMLIITMIIALIFVRTIKGPVDALNERTERIARGDRSALEPLDHHGTREIANLSRGLLSMSEKLQDRSDYIRTFANHVSHELKSPLTSIKGAAELMSDEKGEMSPQAQKKFLDNIIADADRLSLLLDRLRNLAAAESVTMDGECTSGQIAAELRPQFPDMTFSLSDENGLVPMPLESAKIVFSNLVDNSKQHGATRVEIATSIYKDRVTLEISDNGRGISTANTEKIFDLFFTTRRENGGTGMGLGIVQSILRSHSGSIRLLPSENGASFEVMLPIT